MINCYRITDYQVALDLLREQWDLVSEDSSQIKVPDIVNEFWIGVSQNEECAGFFRVGAITTVCYECHVCIRKGFRRIVDYCLHAFQWCLDHIPDLQKLICNVPAFKKGVCSLAILVGFEKQGENSAAFMKNGSLHTMIQFGITRSKMEDACRQ